MVNVWCAKRRCHGAFGQQHSTTQEATYVVDQTPPSRCVWSTAHAATRWDGGLCTSIHRCMLWTRCRPRGACGRPHRPRLAVRGQLAKSPQPEGSESLRRVLELGKDSWEPLAAFGGVSGHLVTRYCSTCVWSFWWPSECSTEPQKAVPELLDPV